MPITPPLMPWTILDSRYLVRDAWMTLRADRCRAPDGNVIEPYYVQESADWVQVVAFNDADHILITHQYRHAAGLISTELPCGTVELGETPEAAARRELLEETGCVVETLQPLPRLSPNPARFNNWIHAFIATGTRQARAQELDDSEDIAFEFLPIPAVMALVERGAFPQALHIASLLLALRARGLSV